MYRIKNRLGVLVIAGVLVACGGGDDDDSAGTDDADTEQEADDAEGDDGADDAGDTDGDGDSSTDDDGDETGGGDDSDDGTDDGTGGDDDSASSGGGDGDATVDDDGDDDDAGSIVITDFDDIPSECIDLMGDFLREIEPAVSEIDWENATFAELESIGTALDVPTEDFDRRSEETGCDRFDIGADGDESLEWAIRVAEREAPGTVGWLEFIANMSMIGDTVDDVANPDDPDDGTAAGTGDCQSTQQLLIEKATEYGSFENVPVSEIPTLTTALGELTQQCTIAELETFYENPTIAAFLEG